MPKYTLNRNYTLRTTSGTLTFEKDVPTHVPPHMVNEALQIGALPAEGDRPDMIPAEKKLAEVPVGDERKAQLFAAFELIIERNSSDDFTGQGVPSVKAIERIVDFDTSREEVVKAYAEFKSLKAE